MFLLLIVIGLYNLLLLLLILEVLQDVSNDVFNVCC